MHFQNAETLQYWNNKKLNEAFQLELLRVQCTYTVINNDFRRRIPRSQTKKERKKKRANPQQNVTALTKVHVPPELTQFFLIRSLSSCS